MPQPANLHDAEQATQRRGTRYYRAGMTIGLATHILTLGYAALYPHTLRGQPSHLLVLCLIAVAGIVTSGIYISVGKNEALDRPHRAALLALLTGVHDNGERLDVVMGLVSAVPGRLDAMETAVAAVPRFEQGVELGAELRRSVLGRDD